MTMMQKGICGHKFSRKNAKMLVCIDYIVCLAKFPLFMYIMLAFVKHIFQIKLPLKLAESDGLKSGRLTDCNLKSLLNACFITVRQRISVMSQPDCRLFVNTL